VVREQKRLNTTVPDNRLTDGGVVALRAGRALRQEYSWYSFLLESESISAILRLEGLGKLKKKTQ
jgi:hypothetical protein